MPKKTTRKNAAPARKKSPAKKPVAKKPAVKSKPQAKKPAMKKTAAKKPAMKKAVSRKLAAKKPVVRKTALKKPFVKKAAPKKQALRKPPQPLKKTQKMTTKKMPLKKPAKAAPIKEMKKALAPLRGSGVKATPATYQPKTDAISRITPIKAPHIHVASPSRSITTKNMTLPIVPPHYQPTDSEEFMNPVMKEYFRQRLHDWRDELIRESGTTLHILQEEGNMQKPDITDRASEETDLAIEFRVRDRERKLLNKINEAIQRLDGGTYGYCEETGDPIPIKRLIAYPTVTMTIEAREVHERRERTQRDQYE